MMRWTPSEEVPPVKEYLNRTICLSPPRSTSKGPSPVMEANAPAEVKFVSCSSRCYA